MIDIKEKLITSMLEANPDLDLTSGSALSNLVVNPLMAFLQGYQQELSQLERAFSIVNPDDIPEPLMDAIAQNYLITRREGEFSQGQIKLYYKNDTRITLPSGLEFTSNGQTYIIRSQLLLTFTASTSPGQVESQAINIIAKERGPQGQRQIGDQFQISQAFTPSPLQVRAVTEFSEASARETNAQLWQRIQASVLNNSLASKQVVKAKLSSNYPDIKVIEVIGQDSPLMIRDEIPNEELAGKQINLNASRPRDWQNENRAQHSAWLDSFPLTFSNNQPELLPSLSEFITEYSEEQYEYVGQRNSVAATTDTYDLFKHAGTDQEIRNQYRFSDSFIARPAELEEDEDSYLQGEITVSQQELRLGATELSADIKVLGVDNFSPVATTRLTKHVGIRAKFTAKAGENNMAYCTVLRNTLQDVAWDGYGLAWRPQPRYLIRLATGEGTAEDRAKFYQEFGEVFSEALDIANNNTYWYYNVYAVDNNVLKEDIFIGPTQQADLFGSVNNFKAAQKAWILPQVEYYFQLEIQTNFATKIWVSTVPDTFTSGNALLTIGATTPNYIPAAGEKLILPSGIEALDVTRGRFGFGVLETTGQTWAISDVEVRAIEQTFPMHLFNFHLPEESGFLPQHSVEFNWWGEGISNSLNPQSGRAILYIYNAVDQAWEKLGEHTSWFTNGEQDFNDLKISGARTLSEYIQTTSIFAATAGQTQIVSLLAVAADTTEIDHQLKTYYVELINNSVNAVKSKNTVDVYAYSPTKIQRTFAEGVVDTNRVVEVDTPFIQDLVSVGIGSSDEISFIESEENYKVLASDPGQSFGPNAKTKILFTSENANTLPVTVTYRKWIDGELVQAELENPETRYPTMSIQAKAHPITRVFIEQLDYTGSPGVAQVKQAIRDFLNQGIKRFAKSDIISKMQELGCRDINADFSIKLLEYNSAFNSRIIEIPEGQQIIQIPENTFSVFYISNDDLEVDRV